MLAEELVISPVSTGELLQVLSKGWWWCLCLCFKKKKIVLVASRNKIARDKKGGRDTIRRVLLFSRQDVMASAKGRGMRKE